MAVVRKFVEADFELFFAAEGDDGVVEERAGSVDDLQGADVAAERLCAEWLARRGAGGQEQQGEQDDGDDDDYGEEDDGSDWDDSFTPEPPPRRTRRRNRGGNAQGDIEAGVGGCIDGIGGCVCVIFGLIILYQVVKHFVL